MSDATDLREKLRKIEALFAGAATSGEREAAGAAADRIRAQLAAAIATEPQTELRFSIQDPWSRKLFVALCRRYGLRPFRYSRMRQQTIVVRGPRVFLETKLWPQFNELSGALHHYLNEVTERIIRDEVHRDAADADEVAEPKQVT
jgi:hypothetical protein